MKGSTIVVMPMMQSRESQKTGLEYEIELAIFDFCFYIIPYISYYILFCFIHKSSISDTILNFLNPWFTCIPNFRSPREPRIFVAQFFVPEDGHKMFSRRPFQGMKPDHQHIKSVKKNAKTFNACLTACWISFSTETQQHRSTCHFFRMPPQDWNMTYLHVFAKGLPTTNRNGPSNCHLPAEVRPKLASPFQLCQDRTTCWTEVDAEQWREIENQTRDWKPLFCDHAGQPHQSSSLDTWSLVYMTNCSTILRSFDSIKFPWNVLH